MAGRAYRTTPALLVKTGAQCVAEPTVVVQSWVGLSAQALPDAVTAKVADAVAP